MCGDSEKFVNTGSPDLLSRPITKHVVSIVQRCSYVIEEGKPVLLFIGSHTLTQSRLRVAHHEVLLFISHVAFPNICDLPLQKLIVDVAKTQ